MVTELLGRQMQPPCTGCGGKGYIILDATGDDPERVECSVCHGQVETDSSFETRGPREIVYDEEMAPLVQRLIEIAKRAEMSIHFDARLDGSLRCTSHVEEKMPEAGDPEEEFVLSWRRGYRPLTRAMGHSMMALTVRDGDGKVTASEVIVS